MTDDLTVISRFLSYVLRHQPGDIGIELDAHGWIDINTLLAAATAHGRPIDLATLERVVAGTDKRRFETCGERIRAAQGHSVPVDLQLTPITPPNELFHGTVERFLTRILAEGLIPKARRHVHLSADVPTAIKVGARRGEPIVLRVAAGEMHAHGHEFVRAANGVWLTSHVPPEFISTLR